MRRRLTSFFRSRNQTITPIVEKGLTSTRAAIKQSAIEALLLYIELDKVDPIIEDLLPSLSSKQPKVIAAALAALTTIVHAYGIKVVDPKPVLKSLPKVFSHADKNVRAEASNLAVELYRWLREAMKTLFWNELKPVQQQDLEKLFEGVKQEPTPKQERLLRSQQAAVTAVAAQGGDEDVGAEEEEGEAEPAEFDAFDLAEPVDVVSKVPEEFNDQMASTKWKDRKDALDALFAVANVDRIKDGQFDDIVQALAKSMKDANVAVVTVAANCVEVLAKGLRRSFGKYRGRIMGPVMERLKEKKQSISDALGAALDAVFASTGLSECLEDILEFLKHKNPQVKQETLKLLIRCLKITRDAPSKPETKSIANAATKLLTESSEVLRSGAAEILGTLMKIMGERAMGPYLEGLDDIRKTKIKEYFDVAEVKAKDKPKPVAPPPTTALLPHKKTGTKKSAPGLKKAPPRAATPQSEEPPPQPKPAPGRSMPSKLGGLPKPGLTAPAGVKKKLTGPGGASTPSVPSPRRNITSPTYEDDPAPAPKLNRGLAGRPLGRPPLASSASSEQPPAPASMTPGERAELDELRADRERLRNGIDDLRGDKNRLTSQVTELQNQNAQLIEDHTRDVLSIKAKETQLVRARSDAEAAEQTVQKQSREIERLKRELSRTVRASSPPSTNHTDPASAGVDGGIYHDSNSNFGGSGGAGQQHPGMERYNSAMSESREVGYQRARGYMGSPSEEKENSGAALGDAGAQKRSAGSEAGSQKSRDPSSSGRRDRDRDGPDGGDGGGGAGSPDGQPVESWKRAAEVTSQLKARIEQMKVCFFFSLIRLL